ncbi:uncharacterized protein EDB91DRAFT_1092729 [Suillus paluster]|uniref:uncharacterized protein n=1 Tax=Suillus paluster TaxID=48578 RepID=UPI001B865EDF|nr:uncharacterized protein EDB91DRAFT_1092729 [Suillus paluster]KAG1756450.1 hypothetical protein EDB91DRAFT_1092729 [Suillus paluster]
MPSSFYIPILLAGMIITGSSNSLWSKWQDMQCVENCNDPDPASHVLYEQPVWQTLQMFRFLPVIYTWLRARQRTAPVFLSDLEEEDVHAPGKLEETCEELRGWKVLLLWFPAACDLTGTTLMNVGLLYTPVSIYQMTRGALVLFVGVLSVIFLNRRLWLYQWVSLLTVMAGISLVGYSGSLIKDVANSTLHMFNTDPSAPVPVGEPEVTKVLVGVFFILFAQVFTATQFVVEEKIMARYSVAPLVAVGYEGLFGALTIILCMPILAMPSVASSSPFFDLPRGWYQLVNTPSVFRSGIAIAISISLFNYFGLSVTRHVSATARSLTDTCRTLSIWLVSLGLGWEKLLFPISLLQVLGFSFLFLFNGLVSPPPFLHQPSVLEEAVGGEAEEGEALLASQHLDDTAALPVDLGQSVHAQGVSIAED